MAPGDELVGASHACDSPAEAATKPVLTRTRLGSLGSSKEIDQAVRAVIHEALSMCAVHEAALGALAPEQIVTQDLCEVWAVSLEDVRSAVARLRIVTRNVV